MNPNGTRRILSRAAIALLLAAGVLSAGWIGDSPAGASFDFFGEFEPVASRALGGAFARLMLALNGNDDDDAEAAFSLALDAERAFGQVLAAEPEYSLAESLRELRAKHPTNPDFESTLKGNAENSYCRSFIAELFPALYIPELAACRTIWRDARRRVPHT